MTETMTVRPGTSTDEPTLAAHEPRHGLVAELFSRSGDDYLLATAWRGAAPLGWACLDLAEDELQPQLTHMYVLPEARRQGVGSALSQWLEQQARERGFREVFLLVDPEKEPGAIPLYLDLEYTPTGDHHTGEVIETGEQTRQAIYRKSLTIRA